jgi:hypothetical protein
MTSKMRAKFNEIRLSHILMGNPQNAPADVTAMIQHHTKGAAGGVA